MIFLKSSIILTLFLIANINPFKFPDYFLTTESSPETITATGDLRVTQNGGNINLLCGAETGEDYCTDPSEYPEETILKALAGQQGILRSFFDVPSIVPFHTFFNQERFYDEKFQNVCSTTNDHIMPRAARNTNGEFMFIVNHPKGNDSFNQRVQVGNCVNAGKECGEGAVFDARTECHQEFLEHKLVSISKDGNNVVVDTFKFPSCCTCRIIKDTF